MNDKKFEYLEKFYNSEKLRHYKKLHPELFEQFYNEMQPKDYNILDIQDYDTWLVNSPDGFVPVKCLICKGTEDIYNVLFTDGTSINTSGLHCFETVDAGWLAVINLNPGDIILSSDGSKCVLGITQLGIKDLVFDLMIDNDSHRYYTNGLSSHNSGTGKSLFLQNLAVNFAEAGKHVVYLTLELSEKLSAMRIDAMHTGLDTRDVMRNIDTVHMKVRSSHMKSKGTLRIKQLPNGCTSNDIRAYIKEYEIQTNIKVECILVDYLDLMLPMSKKISAENLFVKDKYITEELRNLAVELDVVAISASQLNRGSYDEVEFDPSHISGGISKVNTADNVLGIFTSAAMKESGRYQIQFMKTRSSSGVGSRVDLAFNTKSLRITDLEEGDDTAIQATTKDIFDKLHKKSVVRSGEKMNTSTGEITSMTRHTPVSPLEGAAALRALLKK